MKSADLATEAETLSVEPGVPQLFVDDYLIESSQGLRRTLRQPRKDHDGNTPVIAITDEFDGVPATLEANGSIVYDARLQKWVMIALAFASTLQGDDYVRVYRFTSDDAMAWTRGDDGTAQRIMFDLTDKESGARASNLDAFCFYFDEADSVYPYKGWMAFALWGPGREGTYFVRSRDGRDWERCHQILQFGCWKLDGRTVFGPHDMSIFTRDPNSGRFLANMKFFNLQPVDGNMQRSRAFVLVDRIDEPIPIGRIERLALVPPAADIDGDHVHDEYYSSDCWRYGTMWLGALKVWHDKGDYPYSAAGSAYLKFVASRDGLHWKKVQFDNEHGEPEVWIPNGAEGGNEGRNDGGYITLFNQGPLRIGDELVYYYASSSYGKHAPEETRVTGGGIFRARLRLDGFVSVDAGTITTKPLALGGPELFVNGVGPIVVELLSDDGENVLGRAAISGDSVEHRVVFAPAVGLRELGGDRVRLRFSIGAGGELYSFNTH